jgi:hypothetical protein
VDIRQLVRRFPTIQFKLSMRMSLNQTSVDSVATSTPASTSVRAHPSRRAVVAGVMVAEAEMAEMAEMATTEDRDPVFGLNLRL